MAGKRRDLKERLTTAGTQIAAAARPIRVLRTLAWPPEVEARFLKSGARELPAPNYEPPSELKDSIAALDQLRAKLDAGDALDRFLRETCDSFATAGRMLLATGTKQFFFHSVELYGRPSTLSSDRKTTNLDLAQHFDQVVSGFALPPDEADLPTLDAHTAAELLRQRLSGYFPGHELRVTVVEGLSANATASADEIKLKQSARFSQRDLRQIEFHEAQVHAATAINGRAQPLLSFLGFPAPRTTSTQEGLAVLTEFMTRSTSLARVRRLSDRVLAISKAEAGANFIEVFRFFRERGCDEHESFDSTRRVFRGGLMEGGAPFTKDVCYLDGLLRVTNFLRVALTRNMPGYSRWLFAGKVTVEDVPLLDRLGREGLLTSPAFAPAWIQDLSYLTAFMAYAAFLGESDLGAERRRFDDAVALAEDL